MTDFQYKTFSYRFANKGLVARYVYDSLPPGTYRNLRNLESRQENSLGSRYGWQGISVNAGVNAPLGAPVNSLSKMQALGANAYRYAGAGGNLFRLTGLAAGAYTPIASGLSGGRMSMFPYRPEGNSTPYLFIADTNKLLKDNGTFNPAQNWGVAPPNEPAVTKIADPDKVVINGFSLGEFNALLFSNVSGPNLNNRASTTLTGPIAAGLRTVLPTVIQSITWARNVAGTVMTITTSVAHNFKTGMRVLIANIPDATANVASAIITATGSFTFTYANVGVPSATGSLTNAVVTAQPSFTPGMLLQIIQTIPFEEETVFIDAIVPNFATVNGVALNGITATFVNSYGGGPIFCGDTYAQGGIAANTVGTITSQGIPAIGLLGGLPVSPDDLISVYLLVDNPLNILEIKLLIDVGDGTFTQDYYYKSVTPATWQPSVSGTLTTNTVQTQRVFARAAGGVDVRELGSTNQDLLPQDLDDLTQLRPVELNTGANAWTEVKTRLGEFNTVGNAGNPGNTWANATAWRLSVTTAPNAGVNLGIDDLVLFGGSGLDSLAGAAYDYRYTYYNINTATEWSPSVEMIPANALPVQRQSIAVFYQMPTDPQITHVRIYRRGGSLTQAWYFVAQVPVGVATPYLDFFSDATIELNPQLNIDADPPVTSVMRNPLNVAMTFVSGGPTGPVVFSVPLGNPVFTGQLITVGAGSTQEQAYVINAAIVAGVIQVTFFAQYAHNTGEIMAATTKPQVAMNLMAIAFDKAWLAGDPDNPHVLYYSNTFQPEVFPQEQFIEIGVPDAPIMAVIESRGLLYVFTTKRVYQVLGAGSSVPVAIPTSVKHGLVASFSWAVAESVIYYESYDGIYMFQGSGSLYMTEPTEWIWTGKNLGPVIAQDITQRANTVMTYANHELFVSYIGTDSLRHRQIYHDVYTRWRNDDSTVTGVNAEYFEEDTGVLVIGGLDGMVYQDRVNDYDWGNGTPFVPNPITFTMETEQMDMDAPKAFKVYNELTLDMDTAGQSIAISLIFDNGTTILPLGNFLANGRKQVQININAGDGYESQNVGIIMTGSVTTAITFFEVHIRATVEAEFRQSFDSYWKKWETDEWKVVKQGWFEYIAPAGISFNVFIEGNMSAPVYQFTLPASPIRKTEKIRFPAWKATTWRFVATSPQDFQFYNESHIEEKSVCVGKGYAKQKLSV